MQKLRLTRKAIFVCITRANRGDDPAENARLQGCRITDIDGMARMRGPVRYNF